MCKDRAPSPAGPLMLHVCCTRREAGELSLRASRGIWVVVRYACGHYGAPPLLTLAGTSPLVVGTVRHELVEEARARATRLAIDLQQIADRDHADQPSALHDGKMAEIA